MSCHETQNDSSPAKSRQQYKSHSCFLQEGWLSLPPGPQLLDLSFSCTAEGLPEEELPIGCQASESSITYQHGHGPGPVLRDTSMTMLLECWTTPDPCPLVQIWDLGGRMTMTTPEDRRELGWLPSSNLGVLSGAGPISYFLTVKI